MELPRSSGPSRILREYHPCDSGAGPQEGVLLLLGPEGPGLRSELKNCCDRTLGAVERRRVDQVSLAHWFSYGSDRLIILIVGVYIPIIRIS